MTRRSFVDRYQRFGGNCFLNRQGRGVHPDPTYLASRHHVAKDFNLDKYRHENLHTYLVLRLLCLSYDLSTYIKPRLMTLRQHYLEIEVRTSDIRDLSVVLIRFLCSFSSDVQ
jgi:hypothetical protein